MKHTQMEKWISVFFILFLPFIQLWAQNELKGTSIDTKKQSIELSNRLLENDAALLKGNTYSDSWLSTSLFYPQQSLTSYNPTFLNKHLYEFQKLSRRLSFHGFNNQLTHIGLSRIQNMGGSLQWLPLSKLSVELGGFISLQNGFNLFSQQIAYGFNGGITYHIHDRLYLKLLSQYIINNSTDPFLSKENEMPRTRIGANMHYKSTKNSQLNVGVEYTYDQKNSLWKPEAKGKVSIGF